MPMDTEYQTFVSLKSSPMYEKIEKNDRYNLAYFNFTKGFPEKLELEIMIHNRVVNRKPEQIQAYDQDLDGIGHYANYKDAYYDINNPILINGVKKITKGLKNELEMVTAIHQWTQTNVKHILTIPRFQKKMPDGSVVFNTSMIPKYNKISEIYREKIGHCHHITDLFIGLCRIAHIPARKIWGLTISADINRFSGICGEHYVAEIYDPVKKEWFYVEPQDTKFFGINQFWHIISSTEELDKKYKNIIDLVGIRWIEFYYMGNTGCMSYTVSIQK